jgi:hypothetical protein
VTEGGLVVSPNENNRRTQAFRAIVATMPDPGTNTLVVTHKPNILDLFGKDWFEVKEGEASIFKPDGRGTYALIARVEVGQWSQRRAANIAPEERETRASRTRGSEDSRGRSRGHVGGLAPFEPAGS